MLLDGIDLSKLKRARLCGCCYWSVISRSNRTKNSNVALKNRNASLVSRAAPVQI